MAEGCIGGLRLAGGEAVEGDGQVVDPCECHPRSSISDCWQGRFWAKGRAAGNLTGRHGGHPVERAAVVPTRACTLPIACWPAIRTPNGSGGEVHITPVGRWTTPARQGTPVGYLLAVGAR